MSGSEARAFCPEWIAGGVLAGEAGREWNASVSRNLKEAAHGCRAYRERPRLVKYQYRFMLNTDFAFAIEEIVCRYYSHAW
jgi:hypothetical protein